jgi:hypothetical protein
LIKIRTAHPKNSASIARIQVDSYRNAYAPILPAVYLEHFTCAEQEQEWRSADHPEIVEGNDENS